MSLPYESAVSTPLIFFFFFSCKMAAVDVEYSCLVFGRNPQELKCAVGFAVGKCRGEKVGDM